LTSLARLLFDGGPDDTVALHFEEMSWSMGELRREALLLTEAIAGAGVAPGAVVGVMLPGGADVVSAVFGVWQAGCVYLPLNPRSAPSEISRVIEAVRPRVIVTDNAHHDLVGESALVRDASGRWDPAGARPHDGNRHDRDVALVQLTSGTTGRPKAVPLRHSRVQSLLDGVVSKLGAGASSGAGRNSSEQGRRPTPNLVPVSLSLWAGIYQVLFAFTVGAEVVVMPQFGTREFVRLVRRFSITSTVLPPAAMAMLCDDPEVTDLAPLRYVRSITAPLSVVQARRFKERFSVAILNGYGQTELGGEIIGWSAADARRYGEEKLGAVGLPHDGVSIQIREPDGRELGPLQSGELWVKTEAADQERSRSAGADAPDGPLAGRLDAEGWVRTGDVAHVDGEGFVWIDGRQSDMINRGGLKVFPEEVAEVLRLAEAVVDAAVVGVPDPRLGEVPWAFVVVSSPVDTAGLEQLCREHLAPYKVPAGFELVEELPRNEIGKLLRAPLVERALESR
jgi:long-chain acyl-CoA synthetase